MTNDSELNIRNMKNILVMVAVAIMTAMSVQAQIPAEVKDILK